MNVENGGTNHTKNNRGERMKEILFKAKKIDNEEWVESGSIIQLYNNGIRSFYMSHSYTECICTHDDVTGDILELINCRFCKVKPETICQCTDLIDKNGKKIWENDICIVHRNNTDEEDGYFIVKWDNKGERFILEGDIITIDFDYLYRYKYEVIGNIFDNFELLEVKK